MAGTYSKSIIQANKRFIASYYSKPKDFVDEVDACKRHFRTDNEWQAIYEMAREGIGPFPAYTSDKVEYLEKVIPGFDIRRLSYKDGSINSQKVDDTYCGMMARDGAKLYDDINLRRFLNGEPVSFARRPRRR